jgi:hypothetical protein
MSCFNPSDYFLRLRESQMPISDPITPAITKMTDVAAFMGYPRYSAKILDADSNFCKVSSAMDL